MTREQGPLLTHPDAQSNVLSVRAKAMVFADARSQLLLERIEQVAESAAPVLITGETGTGKELVALHLHRRSRRRGDFVAVNCGALSPAHAEAELFGYEAGAFPGATETRTGWFEAAQGGTLFLDEIGDLPLALQAKLLRVLQEGEVVRLGSRVPVRLDVRLLAATNIDLPQAVAAGRFRKDLLYRIDVVTLEVPPLAARTGDILPLAEHFLARYGERLGIRQPRLAPDVRRVLLQHPWPGNIRELENVIHRGLLTAQDGEVTIADLRLPAAATAPAATAVATASPAAPGADADAALAAAIDAALAAGRPALHERVEELLVTRAHARSGGNQLATARLLGVSRNTVRTLLRRWTGRGGDDG